METDDFKTDRIIKDLLKKSGQPEPSLDFTNNVMTEITNIVPAWRKSREQIISRKGWFILGLSIVLISSLIILTSSINIGESAKQFNFIQNYNRIINTVNFRIGEILSHIKLPFWLPFGFFFIILALFIDSLVRRIFRLNKTS